MCEFCEALINDQKIIWNVRSRYADDNLCEYINDSNCSLCKECNEEFKLHSYMYKDNVQVTIEYDKTVANKEGKEVNVMPFSESIQFNYCPICGSQISKDISDWNSSKYKNYMYISE